MLDEGVGWVIEWADYWKLTYDGCGHEQWLPRTGHHLYETDAVEQIVRQYYAECTLCRPWTPGQSSVVSV
jgi:hypothetical protein